MSDKPSSIRNLGPATDTAFARAGITTARQVRDLGADETYLRALRAGMRPHFIGYYVLVMGLQDRPWNDCRGEEKAQLRARFDAIRARLKAEGRDMSGLERILDEIGVIDPPRDPSEPGGKKR